MFHESTVRINGSDPTILITAPGPGLVVRIMNLMMKSVMVLKSTSQFHVKELD